MALMKMPTYAGGGGGCEVTELWTNSNPQASFAAQTIPLDLTAYDGIFIDTYFGDGDPVGTSYHQWFYFPADRYTYTGNRIQTYTGVYRDVTITTSGVTFGACSQGTSQNDRTVPISIYGVKGLDLQ